MMSSRNPRLAAHAPEGEAHRRRQPEGVQLLREACLTLNATAPEVIRSMTVVVDLDDLPVGPSSAADLVERIAGEFGLAAQAQVRQYRLVARVYRRDLANEATGRSSKTVGNLIQAAGRWLGVRDGDRFDPSATTRTAEEIR
jgi:hypothetical protein